MPIIIPEELPASKTLLGENIFVINERRAKTQDIRPLKICILNLMPDKVATETQILRKLSNTIIQIEITLLATKSYRPKNTSRHHLASFYKYFSDIKGSKFDAMIITGAPVEHLEFSQVDYWQEITEILNWCESNVFSSLFICWASQAALYHYYGIGKVPLQNKLFGVFSHLKEDENNRLFQGMRSGFFVPHSRNTQSVEKEIRRHAGLKVLASLPFGGVHLVADTSGRRLFMAGHPEYDEDTLKKEYLRDLGKSNVALPQNYFEGDNPANPIINTWQSDASLFYLNWLNYYVYQETAYEW